MPDHQAHQLLGVIDASLQVGSFEQDARTEQGGNQRFGETFGNFFGLGARRSIFACHGGTPEIEVSA